MNQPGKRLYRPDLQSSDNIEQPACGPQEDHNVASTSDCSRCEVMDLAHSNSCGHEKTISSTGDLCDSKVPFDKSDRRLNQQMGEVPWGVKHIIAGILFVMVCLLSAAAATLAAGELYLEQEDALATWISVHLMAISIAATVWYLGLRHSRFPMTLLQLSRVQLPRKRTVLFMLGVLATSLIATSIYSEIVEWLEADMLSSPVVDSSILFDGVAVILTFQALAFITPLSEEIFFRGFIFRGLVPKVGPYGAMVVSGAIFTGFHLSLGALIPIFITGFLLAWLYWRTGSLWASIGAHAGQNALALIATALT